MLEVSNLVFWAWPIPDQYVLPVVCFLPWLTSTAQSKAKAPKIDKVI